MITIDVETSSEHDINTPEYVQTAKIKWCGIQDLKTGEYFLLPHSEKERAKELIKTRGDVIITFNGEAFDLPILKNNGYLLGNQFTSIDVMVVLKKHNSIMKRKLLRFNMKSVAKTLLNLDKGEIDYHIFEKDDWTPEEIMLIREYLKQDIYITGELFKYCDEELSPLKSFLSDYDQKKLKYLTLSPASYTYSVICNELGIKKEFEDGVVHKKYKGGKVIEPTGEKFIGKIKCLDFGSAYPHMYMMGNLFSNKCYCCNESEKWCANEFFPKLQGKYCSKTLGKIELIVKKFYELRQEFKKKNDPRQYALKVILNVFYGTTANPVFKKLYNRVTASDCTYMVRTCILYAKEVFESNGYTFIYGDTDSNFLLDPFNDEERLLKVKDEIISYIKSFVPLQQDTFDMGIDARIKAMFFIKSGDRNLMKNYLYITEDNELVVKGLRIVKSNASKLSKLIFKKYLTPKILESLDIKFNPLDVRKWVLEELQNDYTVAGFDMKVNNPKSYKMVGQLERQVSLKYGVGVHFMIPTNSFGVGKGLKICTLEDFKDHNLGVKNINLRHVYKELEPFLSSGSVMMQIKRGKKVFQNSLEMWV